MNRWRNYSSKKQRKTKARGKELECWFESVIERMNVFYIRIEVERKRKQPCDFLVSTHTKTWYIELKTTNGAYTYYSKYPEHQRRAIATMNSNKKTDHAGFLVWFEDMDPSKHNLRLIKEDVGTILPDSGICWDFEMLY